jgi:probable rRNA maturation factor
MTTRMTRRILSASGFEGALVSVTVCNDPEIRALNRDFRKLDRATDVLSFPQERMCEGAFLRAPKASRGKGSGPPLALGDVVVSAQTVRRNAARFGVGFEEELARALIHGVLHLLGWDHMEAGARRRMRKREAELLRLFGW